MVNKEENNVNLSPNVTWYPKFDLHSSVIFACNVLYAFVNFGFICYELNR